MTRSRWLLVILVLAALGVGIAVLVAPSDDSPSTDRSGGATRKDATSATTTTGTTAPTTTAGSSAAPSTTAPPTTTGVVPGACGNLGANVRAAVDAGVPGAADGADVTECRFAASDPGWALVQLAPRAGSAFAATTVILQGGGSSWTVVATGGTNAGCGKAPQQVIADLGQFCIGAGGGQAAAQ